MAGLLSDSVPTFIEEREATSDYRRTALYRCSCGNEFVARVGNVKSGNTTSCGCLSSRRTLKARKTTHGMVGTVTYTRWCSMKARCDDPNYIQAHDYGGRGITYDPRWKRFEGFLEDLGECPFPDWSLERLDVDGNYCKANCTWIPKRDQMKNTRRSKNYGRR